VKNISTAVSKRVLALSLLLLLAGCDAPGVAKLRELCITESFPRIHQRVSARGYYDGFQECFDAIRFLIGWDYEFVECREKKPRHISALEPGLYRVSKVRQDSGLCDAALLRQARKEKYRYKDFLEAGLCLALEEIPEPGARYGVFLGDSQTIELKNLIGSKIFMRYMYVKDMHSGELLMEKKAITLFPTPGLTVSSFQRAVGCTKVVPELLGIPGMSAVNRYIIPLTPRKEMSNGNNRGFIPGSTSS
jgi:hypothetical protein